MCRSRGGGGSRPPLENDKFNELLYKLAFRPPWKSLTPPPLENVGPALENVTGMRKFRIDLDFLIEHWQIIYIMPVVFDEIYF